MPGKDTLKGAKHRQNWKHRDEMRWDKVFIDPQMENSQYYVKIVLT